MSPSPTWIDDVRHTIPELPSARRQRLVSEYHLGITEARSLVTSKGLADAFEEAARAYGGRGGAIARWYLGELAQIANERGVEAYEVGISPASVAELQHLIDDGKVSDSMAKGEILKEVVASGSAPSAVVEASGLKQISDTSELESIVDEVIAAGPEIVEQIRGGKTGAINALVGDVMKRTRGQANAQIVRDLLSAKLG
jgi:aspartyl-tRNA(Asn)/glutamyl-tRNA(Gln) amidotransferase subunit B